MTSKKLRKPLIVYSAILAIGAGLTFGAINVANANTNPFSTEKLAQGYNLAGDIVEHDAKEGKCGAGKCGEDKDKGKDRQGKCGNGKCGA